MVLESLTSMKNAEKHPISLFFIAFIVTTGAMILSFKTFPQSSSVLTIAFIALTFMPILHSLMLREEENEISENDVPFAFIATHFNVIHIYSWIFIGLIAAFGFWSVALPESNADCTGLGCMLPERGAIFSEQTKVHSGITGNFVNITGNAIGSTECFNENTKSFAKCFELIFVNNFWVMGFAILFSLIWGAGAIFILGWQASVIGLFIGLEIQSNSLTAGALRAVSFLPHGIPEILAYFIAAIAGGIISAAISKQQFKKNEMKIVIVDTVLLKLLF